MSATRAKQAFAGIFAVLAACAAWATPALGQLPTTNLFARLVAVPDADLGNLGQYGVFAGSGTPEDPYKTMVWYDQVVDPTDALSLAATSQDYGQDVATRRPTLTKMTMPNGTDYWVVDHDGGQGDTVMDYDYLQNKPGGAPRVTTPTLGEFIANSVVGDGGLYPTGVVNGSQMYNFDAATSIDTAYNADLTGLAWAMVLRSDDAVTSGNQYTQVLRTDDTPFKQRAMYFQDIDSDGIRNMRAFTREGAGSGANHAHDYGNYTPGTWIIAAGTWNDIDDPLATDNFTSIVLDEDGNMDSRTSTSLDPDGLTNVVLGRIGYAPNSTTNSGAYWDGQVAELIFWNGGITLAELNQAVEFLKDKYFGAPLVGDVNNDGVVDIFDVNVVSANWGNMGAPGIAGDANNDGVVDIFDVNTISANWGQMNAGNAAAVPEPGTLWLFALGAIAVVVAQRRLPRQPT